MTNIHKKIKILELEPVSDLGGVTHYIDRLVQYLPLEDFEVHFTASGNGQAFAVLEQYGVITHHLENVYTFLTFRKHIKSMRSFLRKESFTIVHAHTVRAGFLAVIAAKGLPVKIVFTGHGWRFLQLSNPVKRSILFLIERYIVRQANTVTYLSEAEYQLGKKIAPHQKNIVVPFSISDIKTSSKDFAFRARYNIPDKSFLVLMVGRVSYQKDPETFIQAARLLSKIIPTAYFVWIGDGDLYNLIVTSVQRYPELQGKIVCPGSLPHSVVLQALRESNVLLFTSHFEGLPITILEAMAARLPIVASAVSGIPEIIHDEETGLLFPRANVHEAVKKILLMYNDESLRKKLSDSAFSLVQERYMPEEKMSRHFAEIYRTLYAANH